MTINVTQACKMSEREREREREKDRRTERLIFRFIIVKGIFKVPLSLPIKGKSS